MLSATAYANNPPAKKHTANSKTVLTIFDFINACILSSNLLLKSRRLIFISVLLHLIRLKKSSPSDGDFILVP